MNIITRIAAGAALGLGLASCGFDSSNNALLYNYTTMGFVKNGGTQIDTDEGTVFNIVDIAGTGKLDTIKRVVVLCDVLRATENKTNEYDVNIRDFERVELLNAVRTRDLDPEKVGTDIADLRQCWYEGGYLNFLIAHLEKDSKAIHDINIEYNDVKSNADTLYFQVRHNANGDKPANGDDVKNFTLKGGYFSVEAKQYKPAPDSPIKITVEWDWYPTTSAGYTDVSQVMHKKSTLTTK